MLIAWIAGYTAMGLAGIQPVGYDFKQFGFGMNEAVVPAGAVRYMDQNGIYGRMSNPFPWGGYFIWTGYPKRTVFIDPRGGLPEAMFDRLALGPSLAQLHKEFGFEVIIADYPRREEGANRVNDHAFSDPDWALVQWDDTSLLYLRRGGRYQALIDRDEYRYVVPATGRAGISESAGDPITLYRIENELKRNLRENPSPRGFGLLGHFYSRVGRNSEAITEYSKVLAGGRLVDRLSAYTGLGTVYFQMKDYAKSLYYYEKAIKIQKDGAFLYNLATIYIAIGDDAKAIKALLEAIKLDPDLVQAKTLLDATYKRVGRK
jgi:tetratricopeptide (TPR) repeat protein